MKLEDYSKYYIQGTDHYLIPKDEFVELFNEMINWKQENSKLKKQYEKSLNDYCRLDARNRTQQQEFIKYLEDDLKEKYRDMGYRHNIFREILDKYLEIIGVSNDKK